jgi:hypothetical protein
MKRFFSAFLLSFIFSVLTAGDKKLSSEDFLKIARNPQGSNHWAMMEGVAYHRRKGSETVEAPIYIAIRFTPERTIAQVIVNGDEGYYVGQKYEKSSDATSIIPMEKGDKQKNALADLGLRPQDLTLTFLFWDMLKELPEESVKGRNCRVFLLESPDKKEKVKAYISSEYYFPLKVEWFKVGPKNEDDPYRTGEFLSFRKEGKFWMASSIRIDGPGWKTKIDFNDLKADYVKNSVPKDLFRKINSSE